MDSSSDVTTRPGADESSFSGFAQVSDALVTGWAICSSDPISPVNIQVLIDSVLVALLTCDLPRQELIKVGFPGPGGGFSYAIPERFFDDEAHLLDLVLPNDKSVVFQTEEGQQLRLRFCFERRLEIEGYVDGLVGSGIRGWVIQHHTRTGEITGGMALQIDCDDVPVEQIVADMVRQDVAQVKGCPPRVGFDFQIPAEFRTGKAFTFSIRTLESGLELHNSPLTLSFPSTDGITELHSLKEKVDGLCAEAWKVQRQIATMLPSGGSVISGYNTWACRYYDDLTRRYAGMPSLLTPSPLISIVVPTYKPNLGDFISAIESVQRQTYKNWELIVVDDASGCRALSAYIQSVCKHDERIKFIRHRRNRGISAATNTAVRRAVGDYIVLFDHDDLLVDVAVEAMVRAATSTGADLLYSDEDKIDMTGCYSEPNFKPDWNYRLLLCQNYVCHLLMIGRNLLRLTGLLRSDCDGAQDHDLILRMSLICATNKIVHVPELLYHWRKSATSTATSGEAKPYAIQAGIRAVQDHLRARGFHTAQVNALGKRTLFSVSWRFEDEPSVCVIIPFKDQAEVTRLCVESLLLHTDYRNWKIVLVDNGSRKEQTIAFIEEFKKYSNISVLRVVERFNYSRLNNLAVKEHPADFYVFLNNDVFITQSDWIRVLLDEAIADPRVAVVGAKLVYPNGTMQHAGVVLGVGGIADHVFRGLSTDDPGYLARAWCAQQYSAVTGACMLCRAEAFRQVKGFDELDLAVAYNDVDICLKLNEAGWRVIFTPALTAEHRESLSRGDDMAPSKIARFFNENRVMLQRWGDVISHDPFYNAHFSRSKGIFTDLEEIS